MTKTRSFAKIAPALLLAAACLTGCAGYRYGAEIDVSNAPPPPRLYFTARPHYEVVSGVYVVDHDFYDADCDVFGYSGSWYAYSGGYWYRARSYNGPYVAIEIQSVPDRIFAVPENRWKHHPHGGPPGQMKKQHRGRGYDWES
ncbi:MAG TPA: hypothetical protein VF363_07730 [Candidatus Eisenbacteria bacterium]